MIVNVTFMVLLNFLRASTQVSGTIITSSKTSLPTSNTIDIFKSKNLTDQSAKSTTLLTHLPSGFIDKPPIDHINSTTITSYSSASTFKEDILAVVSSYIEKWIINQANSSQSQSTSHADSPASTSLPVVLRDVTFFQLWKSIGTIDRGNFTLRRTPTTAEYDSIGQKDSSGVTYDDDSYTRHVSRMKAILVKDTRYTSLIKKWITNRRHGRDFPLNNSSTSTQTCQSCQLSSKNQSAVSSDEIKQTACSEASCDNSTVTSSSDPDGPEARFYDPLMPYPEEYPEEYQTIQNGPALIISRTTYTRIPNVTYTTITMVTLPTYRLVEKAENAFAATLFEERSSKSVNVAERARCKKNSSNDFSQHPIR